MEEERTQHANKVSALETKTQFLENLKEELERNINTLET